MAIANNVGKVVGLGLGYAVKGYLMAAIYAVEGIGAAAKYTKDTVVDVCEGVGAGAAHPFKPAKINRRKPAKAAVSKRTKR